MALNAQALIDRHTASVKDHQPIPTFEEIVQSGHDLPNILIITCADPRCIPEHIFKLQTGEAVVLRVAGGNAQYVLNHLLSIDSLVHFKEAIIVQHTDCGATHFRDEVVKEELRKRAPNAGAAIDKMTFGEITGSLADNVKKSITFLKESPLVPEQLKSNIRGFVFDLKTGELQEVN
ncbi:carbonate hydratase [Cladophialophora carrionii]|uniref:Carbonic anhydrase n=1 Tax=Cladophialophora carrionii TaxID=86049 RepID=A0A1C1CMD5_9EURO|nr:carbonate hydratase [Cladophialophora carrionii]